ncbi:MAG: hypothetical protein LBB74_01085 [Chitinispirillales bacterium]|jgi:hypothetical protein|nr:hypothetical protein [Chitinispirillales bacterium]
MRHIALVLITAALAAASAVARGVDASGGPAPKDTAAAGDGGSSTDTSAIKAANDSLRATRAAAYRGPPPPFDPASHSRYDLFRGDGASAPEILRYRALTSVAVPFSLSNSLNRLLYYGNPAWPQWSCPEASIAARPPFLPYSPRFFGGGTLSDAQTESFTTDTRRGLSYIPYPEAMVFPELSVFWENGVFDQNTLNLRLSRPLSPRLMLSANSQYRFLNGQRFTHERNDVMNFYKTFYTDTANIVNGGYNPHVDEYSMGAALTRVNADSSKFHTAFSYTSLQNEYALNLPAEAPDRLKWAALHRTMYRFDASITDEELRPLRVNAKAALTNEELRSSYRADSSIANGVGGALSFIADADAALPSGAGLAARSMVKRMELFNDSEYTFSEHRAEIFYRQEFKLPRVAAAVDVSAGAALFLGFDTLYTPNYKNGLLVSTKAEAATAHTAPTGRVTLSLFPDRPSTPLDSRQGQSGRTRLSLFAELSPYAVYPDYDPPRYRIPRFDIPPNGVWAKSSVSAGAEAQAQTRSAGILVGYRNQTNDDLYLMRALWPSGYPPYRQPRNTVIIAPWTERAGGFALMSKAIITDTKPFVKASAHLSQITHPFGMEHSFETELGFDYWSENEPFALGSYTTGDGYYYGWNAPIFDLNLKVAAHIKTFRLFYKVDNLLNRKLSYVPGYFSPGLTFRWGINWFLP